MGLDLSARKRMHYEKVWKVECASLLDLTPAVDPSNRITLLILFILAQVVSMKWPAGLPTGSSQLSDLSLRLGDWAGPRSFFIPLRFKRSTVRIGHENIATDNRKVGACSHIFFRDRRQKLGKRRETPDEKKTIYPLW